MMVVTSVAAISPSSTVVDGQYTSSLLTQAATTSNWNTVLILLIIMGLMRAADRLPSDDGATWKNWESDDTRHWSVWALHENRRVSNVTVSGTYLTQKVIARSIVREVELPTSTRSMAMAVDGNKLWRGWRDITRHRADIHMQNFNDLARARDMMYRTWNGYFHKPGHEIWFVKKSSNSVSLLFRDSSNLVRLRQSPLHQTKPASRTHETHRISHLCEGRSDGWRVTDTTARNIW